MYDEFATDYDRFVNWDNRLAAELPFIEKRLADLPRPQEQPLKVLDAACGTGIHAIALAKLGYSVSAADLSLPMIKQARENASSAAVKVDFKTAGFNELSASFGLRQFDAVLCLGNSLPHVLTPNELLLALKDFARCLHPGGILLIQNRNFDAVMASKLRWMEPQEYHDAHTEWLFLRFYDFEINGLIQFNIVTMKRPIDGEWQSTTISTHLAPQKQSELQTALKQTGFSQIQSFGSMAGEPFDPLTSGNLVLIATRK